MNDQEKTFNHFLQTWEQLEEIPFDKDWRNGTGYYNGATKVETKVPVRFQDITPNSRRGIILPINGHIIVLFERYTEGHGPGVIVSNATISMGGGEIIFRVLNILLKLANIKV